ncbi:MAG: sugar kinase [Synergistetes bacterium]|nr:sugar kinase [Synergistota bacterium]
MSKVITFGEIMLRLSPPNHKRIFNATEFEINYGGAEANVASSLAQLGLDAYFVTKLPENEIGRAVLGHLRRFNVKTDYIAVGGERLGIYFLEIGASQRPSKVIYDRKGSAFSQSKPDDYNWDEIFEGASWFHFTGITPALGGDLPEILLEALKKAKEKGITTSCDLNYRKNLWSPEKANEVMSELIEYVDIALGNEEDAEKVFGIKSENTDFATGKLNREGYIEVAKKLKERFNLKAVAITLRESISATVNEWSALLFEEGTPYFSRKYRIDYIVDRVGGGDSFAAGLIYGFIKEMPPQEKVNFAVALSCWKHTIPGDFNVFAASEISKLASGYTSGRVER